MLMLAVSRQLIRQHANVIAGNWRGNTVPRLNELRGRVLGIAAPGEQGIPGFESVEIQRRSLLAYALPVVLLPGHDLAGKARRAIESRAL